ncbi:MAG: LysR family transcriptional regulator [Pyramidobacter sp.]|nr:LysR family transcriptional regulator [Pyramidobacter sp.]
MDAKKLEYLLKVEETRSVTEAARQLYISQPALSQVIGNLEKHYGIKIFEKRDGALRLTPEGAILVDTARREYFLEENMKLALSELRSEVAGDIKIGLSRSRAVQFLPRLLPQMWKNYPHVRTVVSTNSGDGFERRVAAGKLDLAFVMDMADVDPAVRSELTYEPLFSYGTLLAAPPWHPLAREAEAEFDWRRRRPVSLDEVCDEPFIVGAGTERIRRWSDTVFGAYSFTPRVTLVISGALTRISLVEAGVGFCITQDAMAFALRRGAFFRFDKGDFAATLCVIYRKDKYLARPMRYFIDLVKEYNEKGEWTKI